MARLVARLEKLEMTVAKQAKTNAELKVAQAELKVALAAQTRVANDQKVLIEALQRETTRIREYTVKIRTSVHKARRSLDRLGVVFRNANQNSTIAVADEAEDADDTDDVDDADGTF